MPEHCADTTLALLLQRHARGMADRASFRLLAARAAGPTATEQRNAFLLELKRLEFARAGTAWSVALHRKCRAEQREVTRVLITARRRDGTTDKGCWANLPSRLRLWALCFLPISAPAAVDTSAILQARARELWPTFESMDICTPLLRSVLAYGFTRPSEFQSKVIPCMFRGQDVIAVSPPGTGKTASYVIGILQQLDTSQKEWQALVLVPTREFAQAVTHFFIRLGDFMSVQAHACVASGPAMRDEIRTLQQGVHVVIGTPGRVYDIIRRRALRLDKLRLLALDEADEMLSRGFKDQIYDILKLVPEQVRVALFSATMPSQVLEIATRFMQDPIRLLVKRDGLTLEGIKQFYVALEREECKLGALCDLFEKLTITKAIVYCNTRRKVEWLTDRMSEKDLTVSLMCGDMDRRESDIIMREFREGSSCWLITTDSLAHGIRAIDERQASLVINYDLPTNREVRSDVLSSPACGRVSNFRVPKAPAFGRFAHLSPLFRMAHSDMLHTHKCLCECRPAQTATELHPQNRPL